MPDPTLDPLAMPAGEVDTSFPRLKEGVYTLKIVNPEKKTSEKGVDMVVFKVETTKDSVDTDDRPLYAGFKFTYRLIGISGERDAVAVAKDAALLLKACGKPRTSPRELFDNPSIIADILVTAKVGLQKARDGFPESNQIKSFVPPAA